MGLVIGVCHVLILAEVLYGCSLIISLSLSCLLRCNRAKKKVCFSITLCLNVLVLGGCVWLMDLLCWSVSDLLLSYYSQMTFSLILWIVKQLRVIMTLIFQVQGCEICSGVQFWKLRSCGWNVGLAYKHGLKWLLQTIHIICPIKTKYRHSTHRVSRNKYI